MINGYIIKKDDYIFWKNVCVVDDHIFEFIKNKFPNRLILPEFNMIDWFVIDENLPIEIQSTIVDDKDGIPRHAHFENVIRRQLEQNIINYGMGWFFFDEYYLRYLQKDLGKTVSINYDWLYKFLVEEKLKIFTVTYDGKIYEKSHKDFEFIKNFSSTCQLGKDNDSRILQRNKPIITKKVFIGYKIDTEEMRKLRKRYETESKIVGFRRWLQREEDREKLIGSLYQCLNSLDIINTGLDCRCIDRKYNNYITVYMDYLGLTEKIFGSNQDTIKRFVDKYDVAQYFPGYMRNKEKWDYLKESKMKINTRQFDAIIRGKVNPLDWKKLVSAGW